VSIRAFVSSLLAAGLAQAAVAETYTTSRCKLFQQPEFRIQVASKAVPINDVEGILHGLEERVAAGERFKGGETIQIGWMLTKLEPDPDGALHVTEPDMKSIPIKFVRSIDNTLRQLRSQKDTVESVMPSDQLSFPFITQSAVVHVNYKTTKRLALDRAAPDGADSGWWLSDLNEKSTTHEPKNYTKISLYQLAIDRPDLVKFFALPAGLQAVVDGNLIGVLKDGKELPQAPGSFLSELNRVRR
jgi:hypothetical protein